MPAPLIVPLILLGGATIALAAASAKRKRTEPDVPLGTPKTYTLDATLPQHLCGQVLAALSTEKSPAKLEDFAAAIAGSYPLSAAALRIKKGAILSAQTATPYPRFAPTPQAAPAPPASFAQAAPSPPADAPVPTQAPAAPAPPEPPPAPPPTEVASVAAPTPIASPAPLGSAAQPEPTQAPPVVTASGSQGGPPDPAVPVSSASLGAPAATPAQPDPTQAPPIVTATTSASEGASANPAAPAPPEPVAVAAPTSPSTVASDPAAAAPVASLSPSAGQSQSVQAAPDATVAASSTPTSPAAESPAPVPQETATVVTSAASPETSPVIAPAPNASSDPVAQTSAAVTGSPPAPEASAVTPSAATPSEPQASVAPPSPELPTTSPALGNLDAGMPPEMQRAIMGAIGTETDPEKLEGFAGAIAAQYPVGASALMAKMQELRLGLGPGPRTPVSPSSSATPGSPPAAVADGSYKVAAGDFPIRIAAKVTGDGNRWPELVAANPQKKTGADGNFASLQPGEVLRLPESWSTPPTTSTPSAAPTVAPTVSSPPTQGSYKVLAGDFPIRIAKRLTGDGARWPELVAANPRKKTGADGNFASLQPGEVLHLPESWSPTPSTTTATISTGGSHAAHA
jgi:nucleoid-associated protein YgaU